MIEQYGTRGASGTLHILKNDIGGAWCGHAVKPTDRVDGRICKACRHNQQANAERVLARRNRWGQYS